MRSYNFTANADCIIKGYVAAENEEEAIEKIRRLDTDDISDIDYMEPVSNIKITSYDELEEE